MQSAGALSLAHPILCSLCSRKSPLNHAGQTETYRYGGTGSAGWHSTETEVGNEETEKGKEDFEVGRTLGKTNLKIQVKLVGTTLFTFNYTTSSCCFPVCLLYIYTYIYIYKKINICICIAHQ